MCKWFLWRLSLFWISVIFIVFQSLYASICLPVDFSKLHESEEKSLLGFSKQIPSCLNSNIFSEIMRFARIFIHNSKYFNKTIQILQVQPKSQFSKYLCMTETETGSSPFVKSLFPMQGIWYSPSQESKGKHYLW